MNPKDKLKIKNVLLHQWNPIGVNVNNYPNEYDSYIQRIAEYIDNDADEFKITSHLHKLETTSMGLCGDKEKCFFAAKLLVEIGKA